MNNPQLVIESESGEQFIGGKRLASGNLGDVYDVPKRPQDDFRWVLKLNRQGVTGDYIETEYQVINTLTKRLPREQARVLPKAERASVDGVGGLLLEYMDTSAKLLKYSEQLRGRVRLWEWEADLWRIAEIYAQFIREMQTAGYSSNDRKLDDFYYLLDTNRLVVLDWNVIEELHNASVDPLQDVMMLGRAWFNLFGGSEEAHYDMDSPALAGYSVAGRAFLWRSVNFALRKQTYTNMGRVGDDLLRNLQQLRSLFAMNPADLQAELQRLLRGQSLESVVATAKTRTEADLLLLPYWELADMIQYKSGTAPAELGVILRLRDDIAKKTQATISDSLSSTAQAMEALRAIENDYSLRGRGYIASWENTIAQLLSVATSEGAVGELKTLQRTSVEFHNTLNDYITNMGRITPKTVYASLQKIHDTLQPLLQSTRANANTPKTHEALTRQNAIVGVMMRYLQAQSLLLDGDPFSALELFADTEKRCAHLPDDLQATTRALLPSDLPNLIRRLQTTLGGLELPPASVRYVLDALDNPTEALNRYEALLASDYLTGTQRHTLIQMVAPLVHLRDIQALSLTDMNEALIQMTQLLAQNPSPALTKQAEKLLGVASQQFYPQAEKGGSPADDIAVLQLGRYISQLYRQISQASRLA